MIVQFLLSSVLAYFVWSIICLEINVRKARALDVPYVRLPIDSNNVPWTIIQPYVWNILDRFPIRWSSYPDFIRYSRRGWHFADKSETHLRLGSVWALVTPVAIYLHFADPDAIHDIFTRRSDFVRPVKEYKLLEVYGPCISTAGWDDWSRHRKVLAAPFNESIMKFVWDESLTQARAMLRSWTSAAEAGIPSTQRDTRTLSLNVLAATGFRKSYEFHGSADLVVDEIGSYRDSLQTVLDNIIPLMLIPYSVLTGPMVPKSWARIGNAAVSFKKYMMKMLEEETTALNQGNPGSGSIMTAFVHALNVHNQESSISDPKDEDIKKGLSVDEIFGNLFVINFAGHDTTANTLAFSMLLLAAYPQVQTWISEEITAVTKDKSVEEWDYKSIFPHLKRCRAVLLETLRVYPPIMALPKWTSRRAQTIKVGDRMLTIPPGISTIPYLRAVQSHPKYWPDPYTWKPSRWILQPAPAVSPSTYQISDEELLVPRQSTYFPWSDGPQNCPGKKFAEVEAVAVLACIFKTHRLHIMKEVGESNEAAQQRALDCTNDVNMEMLLRMTNADQVKLICRAA
ncbi:cytochrome P450 [Whalleya microplaca]|nr:cytochrome P450 [Whalleya microplaca]